MTNDDKDLKPICSCGHPQSYPIPHRHDWTDREEAIIKHYEFLLRKTTPQHPSELLKELDKKLVSEEIFNFMASMIISGRQYEHTEEFCDEFGEYLCSQFGQPSEKKALSVDIEELAAETHKIYCEAYEKRFGNPYWTNGDYSKLDEPTKEYDRHFVRWAIKRFALPAQREVRYPKQKIIEKYLPKNIAEKCVYNYAWDVGYNQAIDEFKKLNGG